MAFGRSNHSASRFDGPSAASVTDFRQQALVAFDQHGRTTSFGLSNALVCFIENVICRYDI